jgi:hypothetical protein
MALGSTQPLTEMSTRNLPGGKKRPARRADNLAAIYEPNVWKCGSLNLCAYAHKYHLENLRPLLHGILLLGMFVARITLSLKSDKNKAYSTWKTTRFSARISNVTHKYLSERKWFQIKAAERIEASSMSSKYCRYRNNNKNKSTTVWVLVVHFLICFILQ